MKLLKHLSVYTLIGFLGAGINFLLLPYLSHYLSPEDYGILSIINSLVTVLIPLVSLTASGWINVEYYKESDKKIFASKFSSTQLVPLVPLVITAILSYVFKSQIAVWLEIPMEKDFWIPLSTVIAFLTIYHETLLNLTVSQQKPVVYSLFTLFKVITEISLTVFLITRYSLSWEGRLYAWLISIVLSSAMGFIYFRHHTLLTWNTKLVYFKAAIYFGLPLILHTIGKFVVNQADRIFIVKMVSIEEAGVYTIGYQVGMAVLLFTTAVGNFFQPYLFERLKKNSVQAKREIVKTTYVLLFLILILLAVITILSPALFEWLIDARYAESTRYIFWIGLSYLFWGMYLMMSGYIFYSGHTKFLAYLAVLNILSNTLLNYFLIGYFGAIGAAYATCISFLLIAVLVFFKANNLYPMPWFSFNSTK